MRVGIQLRLRSTLKRMRGAQEEQKVAILGARLEELGVDWESLLEAAGDGT